MAEPTIIYDYEFHFSSGGVHCVTVVDGTDTVETWSGGYLINTVVNPDDQITSTETIHGEKLDRVRCVKRVLKDEPKRDVHGQLMYGD